MNGKKLQRDEQLSIRCSPTIKQLLKNQAERMGYSITDWMEFLIMEAEVRIEADELSEEQVEQRSKVHRKMRLEEELKSFAAWEICVWPDGYWCDLEDMEKHEHKSDDFEIVLVSESVEDIDWWLDHRERMLGWNLLKTGFLTATNAAKR
jgi:uncharacterized protein (DUF1778 family)